MSLETSKRKKARLLGLAVLLALLFWLGFMPERRDRVFRAMPANTILVSEHIDLPGQWRQIFDNQLLVGTLEGAGIRRIRNWSDDTNIVWIVRLVCGQRALIGWSPEIGPSGGSSWVGASWAGWRGPLLRAMLAVRWVPGLGRLETTPRGTRYLETASKRKRERGERSHKVAFILRENVLLATLGDDPEAVHELDQRLLYDAPPGPIFRADPAPWLSSGRVPHRAWLEPAVSPIDLGLDNPLRAEVVDLGDHVISLSLAADYMSSEEAEILTASCTAADALAADAASALLLLPAVTARDLLLQALPQSHLLAEPPPANAESAMLYLTTQALGGRVAGFNVPAATLLYPNPAREADALRHDFEQLSAVSSIKLRRKSDESHINRYLEIDWLGGGKWVRADRIVAERSRRWLLVCSSVASLAAQRRYTNDQPAGWRQVLADDLARAGSDGLQGFLWLDLYRTADELRQIAAVYRLANSLGLIKFSPSETRAMETLQRFLLESELLGELALSWGRHGNAMTGRLTLTGDSSEILTTSQRERTGD